MHQASFIINLKYNGVILAGDTLGDFIERGLGDFLWVDGGVGDIGVFRKQLRKRFFAQQVLFNRD